MKSKKIKEEFGIDNEELAVREYFLLNKEFMNANYPLISSKIKETLDSEEIYILDIGTGLGSLARELRKKFPSSKIWAVDISSSMLDYARRISFEEEISNIEFVLGSAYELTFKDSFFDLIVSFGVLHHLKNLRKVFLEIKRVLKKGGLAFLYDLHKEAPQEIVTSLSSKMNSQSKKAFLESVREAYSLNYLENLLKDLGVKEYRVSFPNYSRRVILENKDVLRTSNFLGKEFNKILGEVYFKK